MRRCFIRSSPRPRSLPLKGSRHCTGAPGGWEGRSRRSRPCSSSPAAAGARRARPRIPGWAPGANHLVLITLDTVRADRLPAYGYAGIATPALDAIAREGVRFDNAATTVPFTLPAHSSMLTGLYPPRHGVRENVGYVLPPGAPTLAERLREAGYVTAGFVSAFVLDSRWGIGRGFDTYRDDFDPAEITGANLASAQRDGAETVAAAARWLDERPSGRPFFLWIHLYDAHDPYTPPRAVRLALPGPPVRGRDRVRRRARRPVPRRARAARTARPHRARGDRRPRRRARRARRAVPRLLRLRHHRPRPAPAAPPRRRARRPRGRDRGLARRPPADLSRARRTAAAGRRGRREPASPRRRIRRLPPRGLHASRSTRSSTTAGRRCARSATASGSSSTPRSRSCTSTPPIRGSATTWCAPSARRRASCGAGSARCVLAGSRGAAPAAKPADLDEETLAQLAALGYVAGQGGESEADEAARAARRPEVEKSASTTRS